MNILNYSEYKKKKNRNADTSNIAKNVIDIFSNNLFEYNPPNGLDKNQVERALSNGIACLYKCTDKHSVNYDKWCCTPAYPATVIDNNGTFSKVTTHGTDYALELDVDKDCILLYNNSTKSPDNIVCKYAELISEIDKTILTIVKWSRLTPIPKVSTDEDIAKYKLVMESVLDGNLVNVISDNTWLLNNYTKGNSNELLTLTDTNASEKLHFLSEFREEVIKRLATLYGIPFNTTAKSAQALNAELHGMDIYSLFLLFDRYYSRKESFERASEFTNHDWNFGFSEIMLHQVNDILYHANDENNDEVVENDEIVETENVETEKVENDEIVENEPTENDETEKVENDEIVEEVIEEVVDLLEKEVDENETTKSE